MASSGADREFPEFYKIILHRMRLYSSVRWFFQWCDGFTAVFAPYLYFVLRSYDCYMREAINSYSIKPPNGAYGASLFFALFKTVSDEGSI
jgi:hypothetical protein